MSQPELIPPLLSASPAPVAGVVPVPLPLSSRAAAADQASAGATPQPQAPQRIPRWLERAELFLRVVLRMYLGLFVCCVPWWPTFWDRNPLFLQFPTFAIFAANGAVRGIVSGLGLLNLWIAFQDALVQRDK